MYDEQVFCCCGKFGSEKDSLMERAGILKARQMKAARALLDWSQDDLANATNLSVATIRKLELGHISPRHTTMDVIRRAFEDNGLEFVEPDGVRHRPEDIGIYQGHDGFKTFFNDVYQTMAKNGGDVVVVCASEAPFSQAFGDEYRFLHYDRMKALKNHVRVKCIVTNDNATLPAKEYCEYRWISKHYVDSVPFYVYGDKYAIIVFEADPSPKVIVIQSPVVSRAFRQQFNSMWDKATPLLDSEPKIKLVG
jgi:transcriptional regulator with XRE-family HTH domain